MSDDELVEKVAFAIFDALLGEPAPHIKDYCDTNREVWESLTPVGREHRRDYARAALAAVDLPAVRAEAERAGFQRGFEAGRE